MTTKAQTQKQLVLVSLALLPDDATIDDAIEWLGILREVEISREEIKAGKFHTQAEVEAHFAKWLE